GDGAGAATQAISAKTAVAARCRDAARQPMHIRKETTAAQTRRDRLPVGDGDVTLKHTPRGEVRAAADEARRHERPNAASDRAVARGGASATALSRRTVDTASARLR